MKFTSLWELEHMKRREFLSLTMKAGVLALVPMAWSGCKGASKEGSLELMALPYAENALEPYVSSRTIGFHYGKHHRGYLENANRLMGDTPLAGLPLVEVIQKSAGKPENAAIFNNAAQVFNHDFYWQSMKPGGGGEPTGIVMEKIQASFGDYDKFQEAFIAAAAGQFGSGWAWLVLKGETLEIMTTGNADTPVAHGIKPVLVVDVWEHAYYLDYQNQRKAYVEALLSHLVNWEFAAKNLA